MPQVFHNDERLQAKLRVNAPNDAFEREADQMAARVVDRPSDEGPRHNFSKFMQVPVSRKCAACEEEESVQRKEEEEETLQRQEEEEMLQAKSADGGFAVDGAFESKLNARKGAGSPLPDTVRGQMEQGFGADFGGVRVHTGGEAAGLSRQINAKAFTHGNDVFFGAGEYRPQTREGQRLLAHELTHTIQQGGAEVQRDPVKEATATASSLKGWTPGSDAAINTLADTIFDEITAWSTDESLVYQSLRAVTGDAEKIVKLRETYRARKHLHLEAHLKEKMDASEFAICKALLVSTTSSDVAMVGGKWTQTAGNFSPATDFPSLVRLIRAAEDRMIKAGHNEILDRIRMFRGIYYGTTWSMDYKKEKSTTRNKGFMVYTASTDMPTDPSSILGTSLFDALIKSPEVSDGTRKVDWGHLIIGLEARSKYLARSVDIPYQGGTGLEITTWLGDLGGGAGMVAMRRITSPSVKTKSIVYNASGNDYGAKVNLEGDIAAYVIASGTSTSPVAPTIPESGLIADAVEGYLLPKSGGGLSSAWNSRVSVFAQMIGAKISGSTISNKSALTTDLHEKIRDFACMYALIRLQNKGKATEHNLRTASKHVDGASKETAEIFVDMLEKIIAGTKTDLVASLNPAATAAGPEICLLKQSADAISAGKDIQKGLEEMEGSDWNPF